MPYVTDGKIGLSKKDNGIMRLRLDASEFAWKDNALFIGVKSNIEIADLYDSRDSKEFPSTFCIELKDDQPAQAFFIKHIAPTLQSGKVYQGFVHIDDTVAMYAQTDEAVINVMRGNIAQLVEHSNPSIIDFSKLEKPKGGRGGRNYDPLAKWESFKSVSGIEANTVVELALAVESLPEGQGKTFIELTKALF